MRAIKPSTSISAFRSSSARFSASFLASRSSKSAAKRFYSGAVRRCSTAIRLLSTVWYHSWCASRTSRFFSMFNSYPRICSFASLTTFLASFYFCIISIFLSEPASRSLESGEQDLLLLFCPLTAEVLITAPASKIRLSPAVFCSFFSRSSSPCLYADASERFRSGIVTQTNPKQLDLLLEEQRHEPLACFGSEFKNAEMGLSTFEKEGYAIFQTFEKLDYLQLGAQPAHVYTDHCNLMFVFAPVALEPTLGRHIVSKEQRWALYLSRFPFAVENVSGKSNVFADILTRWTGGYRRERKAVRTI